MRRLSPTLLLLALLLALCSCTTAGPRPAERGIVRLDGTTIDPAALTERIEEAHPRGQGAGVDRHRLQRRPDGLLARLRLRRSPGRPAAAHGYGLYGASLSKAVFAVLVMKLVEQGGIDLDTPLQDYLDEPLWKNRSTSERAWHEDLGDLRDEPRIRRITASAARLSSVRAPRRKPERTTGSSSATAWGGVFSARLTAGERSRKGTATAFSTTRSSSQRSAWACSS